MRTRLIVGFIVVALLSAVATAWVLNLIVPFYLWLAKLLINPVPVQHLCYSRKPGQMYAPAPPAALAFA